MADYPFRKRISFHVWCLSWCEGHPYKPVPLHWCNPSFISKFIVSKLQKFQKVEKLQKVGEVSKYYLEEKFRNISWTKFRNILWTEVSKSGILLTFCILELTFDDKTSNGYNFWTVTPFSANYLSERPKQSEYSEASRQSRETNFSTPSRP